MKRKSMKSMKPGTVKKANAAKARPKALVLLSGGLDSRLVVKMLEEQLGRRRVEAVFFALPFGGGCCALPRGQRAGHDGRHEPSGRFCVTRFASAQSVKLHVADCTKGRMLRKYMGIVRKPRFSRGAAMNPCIDCHLFMLREAKKLAKRVGASIIATGEVLGERPLSQHKWAMTLIEKEAKLEGRVLRPLSARLLPETEAEQKGWVDRSKLLDIQGRRRTRQIRLAKKYKISYPTPGGGCMLTEKEFSKRLLALLEYKANKDRKGGKEPSAAEIGLLGVGRHFAYGARNKSIIIVGRNEKENGMIIALARRIQPRRGKDGSSQRRQDSLMQPDQAVKPADKAVKPAVAVLEVVGHMGPTTVVLNPTRPALQVAAGLTARYSDSPASKPVKVCMRTGSRKARIITARPLPKRDIDKMRV